MKEIPLTQGKVALVDDADYEWLNRWKWCAVWTGWMFYAVRGRQVRKGEGHGPVIKMHAVIGSPGCDHWNRNGLDNQRRNLRPATNQQQSMNHGMRSDNSSGYKGVSFYKQYGNWRAYITRDGRFIHLGRFPSKEEAARAYDVAAVKLFGEFAALNFPQKAKVAL